MLHVSGPADSLDWVLEDVDMKLKESVILSPNKKAFVTVHKAWYI